MSKIGRKPISIQGVDVAVDGQVVTYKGQKAEGTYLLPDCLRVKKDNDTLVIELANPKDKKNKNFWGMHRALLANEIAGSREEFTTTVVIVGLGYKGELKGDSIEFSLGYSHKINFKIPEKVKVEIDKSGQNLKVISTDKFLMGDVAQRICALRRPEPYKGTGVRLQSEQILRKVGKS
ncbi:MAG: 50S ribosomal protein L6 [Epsilonproteobacteria bacterium]|nr:50S ribosomal protein L6 [Campylobacterota bacterium]|tara:strand:+ start:411 stop:944 length:534 start_codon:yes stop_codon:yes gene_type:complete